MLLKTCIRNVPQCLTYRTAVVRATRSFVSSGVRSSTITKDKPAFPKGFVLDKLHNNFLDWTEEQKDIREAVAKIMEKYDDDFWLKKDLAHEFPTEVAKDLADHGFLGICMPEEFGGSARGISEAAVLLQTITESGGAMAGASCVHMNIFSLEPVAKFATHEQKARMLPGLIAGTERACFGVTEPNAGSNTLKLETMATRKGDKYVINGRKMWTSTAQRAQKILLLARTTPLKDVKKVTQGLSLFYTDLDHSKVEIKEIAKMGRHAIDTNMVFFDDWEIPAEDRIGEEGDGFKMVMHGMNAERVLVAAEALGIGYAALRKAAIYAKDRNVFDRSIGKNQAIQHPLAAHWMALEAARLMTYHAAKLYDDGVSSGEYANAAKYLASEAAFTTVERAMITLGGVGYAQEYHIERYMREIMIPRLTPVSNQMILNYISQQCLGQEKSY
ncbi:acyl-CoA dehydrogenase NM domain-like protein [Meredithblackwellia eburnea MCA 4105]